MKWLQESVKSVETLVAPFDCIVLENNVKLENDLEVINLDAESDNSWILKLKKFKFFSNLIFDK